MVPLSDLVELAFAARGRAYAPYSGYAVGASILDVNGTMWSGCNVENISYGLCICAERTALCKMVSEGILEFRAIAVATRDGGTPCGMCLQSLLEFAPDPSVVEVVIVSQAGDRTDYKLSELIPHGFVSSGLRRT